MLCLSNRGQYHMSAFSCQQLLLEAFQHFKHNANPLIITACSEKEAQQLFHSLPQFLPDLQCLYFPAWDTLPYEALTPSPYLRATRMSTLYQCLTLKIDCVITTYRAMLERCPPPSFIGKNVLSLKCKQQLELKKFSQSLAALGYQSVHTVSMPGEFAQRGSLVDVFPLGSKLPYRIDWFDDIIDSIRSFDPDTQASFESIQNIQHLCAHEYRLTDPLIKHIATQLNPTHPFQIDFMTQLENKNHDRLNYFLNLFHQKLSNLTEYLPQKTKILHQSQQPHDLLKTLYQQSVSAYQKYKIQCYILSPEKIWAPTILEALNNQFSHPLTCQPIYQNNLIHQSSTERLKQIIKDQEQQGTRCILTAQNKARCQTLADQLKKIDLAHQWIHSLDNLKASGLYIAESSLIETINCKALNLSIIPESKWQLTSLALSSTLPHQKRHEAFNPLTTIYDFNTIKPGDYIVHERYGIGRLIGIQTMKIHQKISDYLTLEYENSDKVYLPVQNLPDLSRYVSGKNQVSLSRLGSKQWQSSKARAQKHIEQVTAQLFEVYAARKASPGIRMKIDDEIFQAFSKTFPFKLTIDQAKTIDAVRIDLAASINMDRLVCGDVGFGKTEVAMQAACVSALSGYQTLLLAPTTVLAQQHKETLQNRFAEWPVQIQSLTRHTPIAQKREIKIGLFNGAIDILVSTHAGLNLQYPFKNLGLLIIDEEHRFGVRHKELLKRYRTYANILALSATPIPRTLNLALSNYRALSIINSPPAHRLPVKTMICANDDPCIHDAITRECQRGGQIYYCVNDIARLENIKKRLKISYPEIEICIAHGQMPAKQIEHVMNLFYSQHCQLLICTTLIESGLDIPNANTLIIERADLMGMAQLHQLRGRVGRSYLQAFAYLGLPSGYPISKDTQARLDALVTHQSLGAGFKIAVEDLELRGAGEIFGSKQSGSMQQIGVATYIKLLERNIQKHSSNQSIEIQPVSVETDCPCYIPTDYIENEALRMEIYCNITACKNSEALSNLEAKIIDRFGPIPKSLRHLLAMMLFRSYSSNRYIQSIHLTPKAYKIILKAESNLFQKLHIKLKHSKLPIKIEPPSTLSLEVLEETAAQTGLIQILKAIHTSSISTQEKHIHTV